MIQLGKFVGGGVVVWWGGGVVGWLTPTTYIQLTGAGSMMIGEMFHGYININIKII